MTDHKLRNLCQTVARDMLQIWRRTQHMPAASVLQDDKKPRFDHRVAEECPAARVSSVISYRVVFTPFMAAWEGNAHLEM